MNIIMDELKTTLTHNATAIRPMTIAAIRPYLYKHRSPSGTFTFSITQNSATLISESFDSAEMESLVDDISATNFYHGAYKIEFSSPIRVIRGDFQIVLSHSGYAFSESAYLGWIREHERLVNEFTSPNNYAKHPLAVEVWEYFR